MKDVIWTKCNGIQQIQLIDETAWRMIESQMEISTRKLVDSYEEQVLLEEMIDLNKPPLAKNKVNLHPLLFTPFRYPPLKYGSRFGKKTEPSLWYGSLDITTVMAEKAYYQFNLLRASDFDYGVVQVPFTLFSTKIKTSKGVKLNEPPFFEYAYLISSAISYQASQLLGSSMREENVQAFTYQSARNAAVGINVGVFDAEVFAHKKPDVNSFQSWQCTVNNDVAEFTRTSAMHPELFRFQLAQFVVDGHLPFPAN